MERIKEAVKPVVSVKDSCPAESRAGNWAAFVKKTCSGHKSRASEKTGGGLSEAVRTDSCGQALPWRCTFAALPRPGGVCQLTWGLGGGKGAAVENMASQR